MSVHSLEESDQEKVLSEHMTFIFFTFRVSATSFPERSKKQ